MANINMFITLLISLITVLFLIFIEFFTLSFATSNVTDHEALLDIKKHIYIDPFQSLNSWNDSLHFCDWKGIICEKKYKRVSVLDVRYLNLVGTLSPSIGNLTFLKRIYLGGNSFNGIIPQEIGKLFRLQIISSVNNSFQGQLPINLTSCTNLLGIQFYGNNLEGRIPTQLSALSNLKVLGLESNNFIGNIPPHLGNITTLEILALDENNLAGNIPHELGKLFNLQFLGLGKNELSGDIPVEIYNISSIQIFQTTLNHLTGRFPNTLGLTLPKMVKLLVFSNNFAGPIPSTLGNASDLVSIEMGENMLTGSIPQNLGRLQKLRVLQFYNNLLDNDISFIATLTNCTNLLALDLSGNEIRGILPLEISNLSRNLFFFSLSNNHISGNIPMGIEELVGLEIFDVENNILSGNIPPSIVKLINMTQLYLSENNFTGEIPSFIGNLSRLQLLVLFHNMLTGGIPHTISNLTKLEGLNINQNLLNGPILKEVFNMTSLSRGLLLRQNKFTGSLPSEVGNLIHLVWLDVSENELSGEIPISIGGCQMLVQLEMEGNFLNGSIPSTIGQLKGIEYIDLSRNKLSGDIPPFMADLKFLSFLNLSFNMLEGEVPNKGVFINASSLSILGNINLCGGNKSLNLSACPIMDSKNHRKLSYHILIILVLCIFIVLVSLFGCAYAIFQKRKSIAKPSSTSPYDKQLLQISYADILTSTNGFSSENLLGEGKYGSVYRGVLKPSDKVVAFKVLKLQLKGAHKSFLAECEALRNIRHRNLVQIITSCSSIDFKGNDFKALVLEYYSNGSLEEWLHQDAFAQHNEKKLDFLERLNIAIDIATALDYLHNHSGNPIIHCDIKPSNILLGDDLHGMVTDFGLAKFLPMANDISHDIESTSIGIRGTIGYVAPEYGMGGDVSAKGDIYSYGILLLEMFTGIRPTDTMFTEDISLHNYVNTALDQDVAKIIDPKLLLVRNDEGNLSNYTSTIIESCCLSIFRVGVSCSSLMKNDRMDIYDALNELQHVKNEL